ncbi:PKD domain-containing protein [Candidatus Bipolaricaulota bacterium]|nr:PKD domain-containing protein [Candidatus Bipolaricaulota bacterium]
MEENVERFEEKDIKKFTGPIEHWLTTFKEGFWGLEEKYSDTWSELESGQLVLFHGSHPKHLSTVPSKIRKQHMGIIGLGVIGSKSKKENPNFLAEFQGKINLPLLINFSEMYWFGNINGIRNISINEKTEREIQQDIGNLLENLVSFGEMDLECDYRIPPQRSAFNVKKTSCLTSLAVDRMKNCGTCKSGSDIEKGTPQDKPETSKNRNISAENNGRFSLGFFENLSNLVGNIMKVKYWERFFSSKGRISKYQWWRDSLTLVVIYALINTLFGLAIARNKESVAVMSLSIFTLISAFGWFFFSELSVCAKRWHDRGKSARWNLIVFVPLINFFWFIIELGLLGGDDGENEYGESPEEKKSNQTYKNEIGRKSTLVLGTILGVLFFLAAVFGPVGWYWVVASIGLMFVILLLAPEDFHVSTYPFSPKRIGISVMIIISLFSAGRLQYVTQGLSPEKIEELKNTNPKPSFTFENIEIGKVLFTPYTEDPDREIEEAVWHFGDGNKAVVEGGKKVEHKYGLLDQLTTVKLTITDIYGNEGIISKKVGVSPTGYELEPHFDIIKVSSREIKCIPTMNNDSEDIKHLSWHFENGESVQIDKASPIKHKYDSSGIFEVKLRATDIYGNNKSTTQTVAIKPKDYKVPIPDFDLKRIGLHKIKLDPSIRNKEKKIKSWVWDFGDGNTKKKKKGNIVTHEYQNNGPYAIELKVTDRYGGTNISTRVVNLKKPELKPEFLISKIGPREVELKPSLDNTDVGIKSWVWDFGDGNQKKEKEGDTVTHKYNSHGKYNIKLKIVPEFGSKVTTQASVEFRSLKEAKKDAKELARDIERENWGSIWERFSLSERKVSKSRFILDSQGKYISEAYLRNIKWYNSDKTIALAEIIVKANGRTATISFKLKESPLPTDHNYWEIVGGFSSL